MKSFTNHSGQAVAIDQANIDTDQIIPKQFLKTITREGLGIHLFDAWRYKDEGYPGKKAEQRQAEPTFPLNIHPNASVLLAKSNFGCGSSREHAVWSLLDYGIRVVIAPSFADIFSQNSIKNGLLLVPLEEHDINQLFAIWQQKPQLTWKISLEAKSLTVDDKEYKFNIEESSRQRLLQGLDGIGVTLKDSEAIRSFEQQHKSRFPWLFTDIVR